MQKVLIMHTYKPSLRNEVIGWSHEDGDEVGIAFQERIGTKYQYENTYHMPVGLIGSGLKRFSNPPTVLHALGEGWKLLAPPVSFKDTVSREEDNWEPKEIEVWEWWLVRD